MLADSQELFIAISYGYSFPGMHCVTSNEGVEADGEIVINRSINTMFALCAFPLHTDDRCLPLSGETAAIMSSAHGCSHHMMCSQECNNKKKNHSGKVSHRKQLADYSRPAICLE